MGDRTQEQLNADHNLGLAIEACFKAYSTPIEEHGYALTDYVVLTAVQKITDDGIIVTRYPYIMVNGDMPWYKMLGLIDAHRTYMREAMRAPDVNG